MVTSAHLNKTTSLKDIDFNIILNRNSVRISLHSYNVSYYSNIIFCKKKTTRKKEIDDMFILLFRPFFKFNSFTVHLILFEMIWNIMEHHGNHNRLSKLLMYGWFPSSLCSSRLQIVSEGQIQPLKR